MTEPRASRWYHDLERFGTGALLMAGLAALLVVASGAFRGRLEAARWLVGWVVVAYLVLALAAFLLAVALALVVRRPGVRDVVFRAIVVAASGLVLFSNLDLLAELFRGGGGFLGSALGLAALLACVLGLLWASAGRSPGLGWLRVATTVAFVCCSLLLWPVWRSARGATPAPLTEVALTGERLLVIGLDGADWKYIDQLVARGDMPNLARLKTEGAWGPLGTIEPTASPVIWTTVVTGRRPAEHGIFGHVHEQPVGLDVRLPTEDWGIRRAGLRQLLSCLAAFDLLTLSPSTSAERLVPAYWNVASHFGVPVNVVSWWATWPAEPVAGRIVSDRAYFWRWATRGRVLPTRHGVTFPEGLYDQISESLMAPEEVTLQQAQDFMDVSPEEFERMRRARYTHHALESEFKYLCSMFASNRQIARRLMELDLERGAEPADLLVLFRMLDLASHSALVYSELVSEHLDSSDTDLVRYGRVVSEAYRQADTAVGELVRTFGPANVVILSDHGFQLEERKGSDWSKKPARVRKKKHPKPGAEGEKGDKVKKRRKDRTARYGHSQAPDGIFVATGPAFRTGLVEGLDVYDVMTMLLYLKGLPISRQLERTAPPPVFTEEFTAAHPPLHVEDYGFVELSDRDRRPSGAEEEMVERLKALGYVE